MKWLTIFFTFFSCILESLTPTGDPWLLTPGPLTTSATVKTAMLHDYGSRDPTFIQLNKEIRETLLEIVGGEETHVVVPLQGSGTFVVEAMLRTMIPKEGKALILINGVYGRRIQEICKLIPKAFEVLESPENEPIHLTLLKEKLNADASITHVVVVYCETTTGILNPLQEIAHLVAKCERKLLIDAMSAFGALPLDTHEIEFDAVCASSNKCLQGVPGVGFCIAKKVSLEACSGNAGSLSLDLYAQWKEMERSGQWRFTPPTHALLALHQALLELKQEGGVQARHHRYMQNCKKLREGMIKMGFQPYLSEDLQAPIIVTFLAPDNFNFLRFYELLKQKDFLIYPGKLTNLNTFRVGCIGDIGLRQIEEFLQAVSSMKKVL